MTEQLEDDVALTRVRISDMSNMDGKREAPETLKAVGRRRDRGLSIHGHVQTGDRGISCASSAARG